MKGFPLIFIGAALFFLNSTIISQTEQDISIAHLKSNMEFLADDLLEGRNAASRGEWIASLYIAKELQKYGIEPFGDSGTYYQNFDLEVSKVGEGSGLNLISSSEEEFIENGSDMVYYRRYGLPDNSYSGDTRELVFAGHGITAEEFNHDDYKDIDVKDKVVLVVDDMPYSEDEDVFHAEKHKEYATAKYKRAIAAENGAAGIIIIAAQRWLVYWPWLTRGAKRESFDLIKEEAEESAASIPLVVINDSASVKFFQDEIIDYDSLVTLQENNTVPDAFTLSKTISLQYEIVKEIRPTRNVLGILPGNDEDLQAEYVTIGAHYDHVGITGEDIYNGADDNASGTVSVLEVARIMSQRDDNDRPIVFSFYSAEEKGLLGSKYMADNVDWISDAIVNINLDMVGRRSADSIYVIGSDRLSSELYEIVEEENEDGEYFVLDYTYNDPDDPQRFYWRSDHVQYVKRNIPIVFFFDYMKADYHKPTDTAEKISYLKLYKVSALSADIAETISNLSHKLVVDMITAN